MPAERNPTHLLFFVLFFPHLIAGPIVRASDFLPQIRRSKRWSWARFQLGGEYFLLGLLKKWVVADQLALYADPVFADPAAYGTLANWLALLAFTLQVYCDISGYSDMALGTAHLLGYKLAINFNMPYLATSVADYWRRNHISLSTWLRDYLFIPLGGSRGVTLEDLSQLPHHHDARRSVARSQLELRPVGLAARHLPVDQPFLPLLLLGSPAPGWLPAEACRARPCAWR